jgi:prepilin-type N-terminal cleavage/methylation domain-containing protein
MRVESQERSAQCRKAEGGRPKAEGARRPSAFRRGMTLVELLVVILIITILGAMILGVAALAGETAREAKTRTMVNRLHTLLVQQYDSYKNRRIDTSVLDDAYRTSTGNDPPPEVRADHRLLALRQLMKLDMPDRWSDLLNESVDSLPPPSLDDDKFSELRQNLDNRYAIPPTTTDLWSLYIRQYRQMADEYERLVAKHGANRAADIVRENQGAECLYMIIMYATGDGEARSLFTEDDIGDIDGDGAPEFLDGWGHPIQFLRWAPGFNSEVQLNPIRLEQIQADAEAQQVGTGDEAVREAVATDHDPFDIYRRDVYDPIEPTVPLSGIYAHLRDNRYSYRLVPLVYSAGRDEIADIYTAPDLLIGVIDPYAADPNGLLPGTPFTLEPDGTVASSTLKREIDLPAMGGSGTITFEVAAEPSGATDNIHNHLISTR